MKFILALDQGTTSSRSIIFDHDGQIHAVAQQEFKQHYPQPGWVEHDPEEIWATQLATAKAALEKAKLKAGDIAAIGITNQRETTVLWDRKTGQPVHNAIVWQDRRTAQFATKLEKLLARKKFRNGPASCQIRISPAPRSNGCSIIFPAYAVAPKTVKSHSARLIAGCCGN